MLQGYNFTTNQQIPPVQYPSQTFFHYFLQANHQPQLNHYNYNSNSNFSDPKHLNLNIFLSVNPGQTSDPATTSIPRSSPAAHFYFFLSNNSDVSNFIDNLNKNEEM